MQDKIHVNQLNEANEMLHQFVSKMEDLYGLTSMTYNVHQCLHVCEYVLNWGPLWTSSAFAFEGANYYMLKAIKASRGATFQIVRYVNTTHTLMLLEDNLKKKEGNDLLWSVDDILSRKAQNTYKSLNNITYFGGGYFDNETLFIKQKFNLHEVSVKFYKKMIKKNCLYDSCLIKKSRSNNSFAMLRNDQFVKIVGFIVDDLEQETTVCHKIDTVDFLSNKVKVKAIVEIREELDRIPTEEIEKICVHMLTKDGEYICVVPNNIHY